MTMESVGKAAYQMIEEVRRQFHEIPGLLEGKAKADYQKCVDISTAAALHEMIMPGVIAIVAPLLVGFLFGTEALGGFDWRFPGFRRTGCNRWLTLAVHGITLRSS